MTNTEFIEASNRLESYYEKEYTTEQLKIMYEELKGLTIERYRKVIAGCIRNCKFLPKVADMIKANMEIVGYSNENNNKVNYKCNKCEGTGYVVFNKIVQEGNFIMPYTYVARCTCENAQYSNKELLTYTELGIDIGTREEQVKDTIIRDIEKIREELSKKCNLK